MKEKKKFLVLEAALRLVGMLKPLNSRIKGRDRALSKQLTDAANSVVLNLGESEYSDSGNRLARLHTAAGSASEVKAAVRVSVAWGHISSTQAERALAQLDELLAMLWVLTKR